MFTFDFSKFREAIEGLLSELPTAVEESLDTLAEIGSTNAKSSRLFKNQTGKLRSEITRVKNGQFIRQVISPTSYAKYVEFGNRPNGTGAYIYPKKAKALRFMIGNRVIFAKRVRSHGPLPYMGMARTLVTSFIPDLIQAKLERLAEKYFNK